MGPQLLAQMLAMGGSMGGPVARPPAPEPDPFARPYDPVAPVAPVESVAPVAPVEAEKLRLIQGLLQPGQHQDILSMALQDARRPSIYMFDRSGGLQGAVDSDKRLGYGALASLLGADADRYGQNMADQQFQDELDFRQLPYQQMTAAEKDLSDFRREELQQRAAHSMMPYERMTPFEEGTLDVERERLLSPQGRGGLSELDQQIIATDPAMQAQYRSQLQQRIFGDAPPPSPGALRDLIADQVNDNEVSSIVDKRIAKPREEWTIQDYSDANTMTAEMLWEQVQSGHRSIESARRAAERSDANLPSRAKSTLGALKKLGGDRVLSPEERAEQKRDFEHQKRQLNEAADDATRRGTMWGAF